MVNWGNAAVGAASGGLQGGLPGAIIGGVAGLFGGNAQEVQTMEYESLSGERQGMLDGIMKQLPGIMEKLSPEAREQMIAKLENQYGEAFTTEIKRSFATQRGAAEASFARSGTGPASIMASQRGNLARQEGEAVNKAGAEASIMAHNIGSNAYGQYAQTASGLMNTGVSIFNSRRQTKGTREAPGSQFDQMVNMGMGALVDEGSWWNTRGGDKSTSLLPGQQPRAGSPGVQGPVQYPDSQLKPGFMGPERQ